MSSRWIVWFRREMRLSDQPALHEAVCAGAEVIPVYVHDPDAEAPWAPGAASRWWLHRSLLALDTDLRQYGSRLVIARGDARQVLPALARDCEAGVVVFVSNYEPAARVQEQAVSEALRASGVEARPVGEALLHAPAQLTNGYGRPYLLFTPFWRALQARGAPPLPIPAPKALRAPKRWPRSHPLAALELEPRIDWAAGLRASWTPGETGARARLAELYVRIPNYASARDRMAEGGTSYLSPHLHFGEISARQIWHAVRDVPGSAALLRQLAWREFAHHLLFHYPHLTDAPLRAEFARFPWRPAPELVRAWQRGETGYPMVDAGMRELWTTGFMHNRARMIAASFLVKHLLQPWLAGARWFWDTLCDADLANNTLGWQWVAGSGPDAAPYFRIFNPVVQGRRFDPQGVYVKRWLPELYELPERFVHEPWVAPSGALARAGIELGRDYPRPIVDHAAARARALAAFRSLRLDSTHRSRDVC